MMKDANILGHLNVWHRYLINLILIGLLSIVL